MWTEPTADPQAPPHGWRVTGRRPGSDRSLGDHRASPRPRQSHRPVHSKPKINKRRERVPSGDSPRWDATRLGERSRQRQHSKIAGFSGVLFPPVTEAYTSQGVFSLYKAPSPAASARSQLQTPALRLGWNPLTSPERVSSHLVF